MTKFYLNFISDGSGVKYIDEPIGFSDLTFDLVQKDKGYARDEFFNGGESQLSFSNYRNHYLDLLLYYFHYYGFEAKAQLGVEFDSGEKLLMDIDFATAVTDDLQYFNCKCIEVSEIQIVKRRESVKVDLFSDKDIDGNPIVPVKTFDILINPKAVFQSSEWSQVSYNNQNLASQGATNTEYVYVNPCANIVKSDLKDTLSWFELDTSSPESFYIHQAASNETNIKVDLNNIDIEFNTDVDNDGDGFVEMKLYFRYGKDLNSAISQTLISAYKGKHESYSSLNNNFTFNIPSLNRGDKIWVFFEFKIRQSSSTPGARFEVFTTIKNMVTKISATSKSYSSTTKGIRLIDAVKQVIKSISGKDINAPSLDLNSLYYNTMLFNGNLLRGIIDKSFYLSLEDIRNSLCSEFNGDFEVDDKVFFGNERDFYTNNEIWVFDETQFSEFQKKPNQRFCINEFSFKYKNYQALKENEQPSTADTIHGEIKMTLPAKMVENKKDISVNWIRDGFLIEEARNKSLEISDDTSSQDDDNVFAIDTIENTTKEFTETSILFHEYDPQTAKLILRSKESPNFKSLGIVAGQSFDILSPDSNSGGYLIVNISENSIELNAVSALPNSSNDGEKSTTYKYLIDAETYPFKNRTNEGITNISSLTSPETYSNIRFSARRNIERNFNEYLSTSNIYRKTEPIKKTWYKNNPDCQFDYEGITTIEGSYYLPNNPILSAWIYENALFANVDFEDFVAIRNKLKSKRGFIRCIDKIGNVLKLYPQKMTYKPLNISPDLITTGNIIGELNITGESKYEPEIMAITTDNDGFIQINKEVTVSSLIWEIKDHYLFIFDSQRQRLFNPVFWNNVTINGGFANSERELKELLNLL